VTDTGGPEVSTVSTSSLFPISTNGRIEAAPYGIAKQATT
jgi:hypothetical protein